TVGAGDLLPGRFDLGRVSTHLGCTRVNAPTTSLYDHERHPESQLRCTEQGLWVIFAQPRSNVHMPRPTTDDSVLPWTCPSPCGSTTTPRPLNRSGGGGLCTLTRARVPG